MPEEVFFIALAGIMGTTVTISTIAISIAWVIRSRRKQALDPDSQAQLEARLSRIETAIDAVATEVERVAADQRSTSRRLESPARHP